MMTEKTMTVTGMIGRLTHPAASVTGVPSAV